MNDKPTGKNPEAPLPEETLSSVEKPLVNAEESLTTAEESLAAAKDSLSEAKESLLAAEEPLLADPVTAVEEPLVEAEESLIVAEESLASMEESLAAAKESLLAAEESLSAAEEAQSSSTPHANAVKGPAAAVPPPPPVPAKPPLSLPTHAMLALPAHEAGSGSRVPRTAPPPVPAEGRIPWTPIVIGLLVALAIVAAVLIPRYFRDQGVKEDTEAMAVPTVTVLNPKAGQPDIEISLPGNVESFYDSPIYARTSGYLKRWLVDIGAKVKAGQLLAEIETPEVDQELDQARAALSQTEANLILARTTATRWRDLMKQNAVAQQEVDERNGNLAVQEANLSAQQANVKRLEALVSFQKVVAPFDGVITARQTDVGALITAGSGTSVGPELFHIAQTDRLRVYVNVPEGYASAVTLGTEAKILLNSAPNAPVTGKVTNISGAIDPSSKTLLVQLEVPNADGKLLPGGYAQVTFHVLLPHPPLIVPINTLLFRAAGNLVGVVNGNNTVDLRKVKLGRDFGNTIEIVDGLKTEDRVILNPADSLQEGTRVHAEMQKPPAKKS